MGINVLSLFDGCSIALQALKESGITVDNYFSSEIDKFAIKVSEDNHPETKRLGCVKTVNVKSLPKIDLIIGGSPCQGFSFAGKQLNFSDDRSKLFFEFLRITEEIREINPEVKFILENVRMKKEYKEEISRLMGVNPIEINSSLVSAQDRKRLFWTNIQGIEQPEDEWLFLPDILQLDDEIDPKYTITGKWLEWLRRNGEHRLKKKYISLDSEKAITMTARQYQNWNGNFVVCGRSVGRYKVNGVRQDSKMSVAGLTTQELETRTDGKTGSLTTVTKDNLVISFSQLLDDYQIRRLTPIECERLQSLPDNYSKSVSDSQRYKMMGNGFNSKVISHILRYQEWK